ncbi:hypothetical protein K437DRAFT_230100, partial [Tilletiaria anomala UBC 951]
GAWALDIAKNSDDGVEVLGIDISSNLFPENTTKTTFLKVSGTVLDLPRDLDGEVSLVNQRLLIYALRVQDWKEALASIHRVLVPGAGFVQLTEVMTPVSNSGSAQKRFFKLLSA